MEYLWIAFTDLGIKTFDPAYPCDYVQQLLKLYGCKDYILHLTNKETLRGFAEDYLESCYQLEYIEGVN